MLQTFTKINDRLPISGEFAVSPIAELSTDTVNLLNADEQEELSSFNNERRKKEFATSRLMLKELAQEMGMKDEKFMVVKDELGCPHGKCGSVEYCISIAHTQNDVFCGITRNAAIGVDMEPLDRAVPERLKRRMLHPDENQIIKEMDAIRLWTIKEALIKVEGKGLRMNMIEVLIQTDKNGFFVEINNDKRAKICSFQAEGNWLAVAYYS